MKYRKLTVAVFTLSIVAGGLAFGVKRLPPGFWWYLRVEGTLVLDPETRAARLRDDRRMAMVSMRKGLETCAPDEFLPAWAEWQLFMALSAADLRLPLRWPANREFTAFLKAHGQDEVDSMFEAYRGCVAERTTPTVLG